MPFFAHLNQSDTSKIIKNHRGGTKTGAAKKTDAAGHGFQTEIQGRSPCNIQDHPRRLFLDSSVQNGWSNCFDFVRILFQHV